MVRQLFAPLLAFSGFALPASGQTAHEIAVYSLPVTPPAARPPDLAARLAAAAAHPLGSRGNPVRVLEPKGQRVYLASLRCADGRSPHYRRRGNVVAGVFGTIVDAYEVTCSNSAPAATVVYLDMYHPDHLETLAPPGFGFVAPQARRMRLRKDDGGKYSADPDGPIDALVLIAEIVR
jgi:hypothetical protein